MPVRGNRCSDYHDEAGDISEAVNQANALSDKLRD